MAIEKCYRLWKWFALTGSARKKSWPDWGNPDDPDDIRFFCFACQEVEDRFPGTTGQDYDGKFLCAGQCIGRGLWLNGCGTSGALYSLWVEAGDKKMRKATATIIANHFLDLLKDEIRDFTL